MKLADAIFRLTNPLDIESNVGNSEKINSGCSSAILAFNNISAAWAA